MGTVVNQPAGNIKFPDLLVQLDLISDSDSIQLPLSAGSVQVLKGGPVGPGRGFVLHSSDYFVEKSTLPIDDDGICLDGSRDVLKSIAKGNGPGNASLALGYASRAPGRLEHEIQDNGWLHCTADADFIFGADVGTKYDRALRKAGIL